MSNMLDTRHAHNNLANSTTTNESFAAVTTYISQLHAYLFVDA